MIYREGVFHVTFVSYSTGRAAAWCAWLGRYLIVILIPWRPVDAGRDWLALFYPHADTLELVTREWMGSRFLAPVAVGMGPLTLVFTILIMREGFEGGLSQGCVLQIGHFLRCCGGVFLYEGNIRRANGGSTPGESSQRSRPYAWVLCRSLR